MPVRPLADTDTDTRLGFRFGHSNLEFGIYLGFGAWNLGFKSYQYLSPSLRPEPCTLRRLPFFSPASPAAILFLLNP
jgi:hypothetical protein